jgi:O-antigen/teichoic acid export membrane protein
MQMIRTLLKNKTISQSLIISLSTIVSALSRLLMVTLLARHFSNDQYGVWVSITSVAAIMMFGDFGITNALRNKISMLNVNEHDSQEEQRQYFFTSLYFFTGISIILLTVFLSTAEFMPIKALYNTTNIVLQQEAVLSFVAVQSIFILCIPWGIANGLYFSYEEGTVLSYINITSSIMLIALIISATLFTKIGVFNLALVVFSVNFLSGLTSTMVFLYRRKWLHSLAIDLKLFFPRIKELLLSSLKFLSIQLSGAFISNSPTVAIAAIIDLRTAASYNIIQKLFTFVITVYQSIFNPFWGKYAKLAAQNNWMKVREIDQKLIAITALIFAMVIIFFSIFSKSIIHIFVGPGYESNLTIILLLGISYLFNMLYEASSLTQNSIGRINLRLTLQLIITLLMPSLIKFVSAKFELFGICMLIAVIWMLLFIVLRIETLAIIKRKI